MAVDPNEIEFVTCPHCDSSEIRTLPRDFGAKAKVGMSIPIIGCGAPWHYGIPFEWNWLKSTHELQSKTYHYPLDEFSKQVETGNISPALAHYLLWNTFAVYQELAELAYEFSWKPWATDEPFANKDRILNEVVDINHFLGNILTGIGITDSDYEAAYREKQQKNRDRAASGSYSAKKGGVGEGSDL